MLLIQKTNIFDMIMPRYFPIWKSKEMSHDFVRGQSVAETCFSRWGYVSPTLITLQGSDTVASIFKFNNSNTIKSLRLLKMA